jgi:hypothetical protein
MDLDSNAYLQALVDAHKASNTHLQTLLEELRASKQQLGFGHSPRPRYIYVNRQYPECLWYFWDGANNKPEPISFNALTGIIEKLETDEKEFKGKRSLKINLHIRAERNYVIESGSETMFSKGLLYAISKLPITAFKQAITIAVEPGEDEKVSFCRIYNPSTGQSVYAPYTEPVDWQQVIARAAAKINAAHGRVEQEPQQKTA